MGHRCDLAPNGAIAFTIQGMAWLGEAPWCSPALNSVSLRRAGSRSRPWRRWRLASWSRPRLDAGDSPPTEAFSLVAGLRVEDGTVGCRPKRASRREEREKPRPRRPSWLWRCQRFSQSRLFRRRRIRGERSRRGGGRVFRRRGVRGRRGASTLWMQKTKECITIGA